jgi:Immunity protein 10
MDQQSVTMTLAVDVAVAAEDEELGVYSANFGCIATGHEWLISVQLPINVSEQDISLRHDTYAITTSTGATHYGGVIRWGFWAGGVFLDLENEAAETLSLGSRVNFQLPATGDIDSTIGAALTQILGSHT